jgi:hypothetical protein
VKTHTSTLLLLCIALSTSCASGDKRTDDENQRKIHKIVAHRVKIRRWPAEPADPAAMPDEKGYRSRHLPNQYLDCEAPAVLFEKIDLQALGRCFKSIQSDTKVLYRIVREDPPFQELDDPEKSPECLRRLLPRIPMPRNIFFQSNEEGEMRCYHARFDTDADRVAGIRLPIKKIGVRLDFPLAQPPRTEEETRILLEAWSITPFWDPDTGQIACQFFPSHLCNKCFGQKNVLTGKPEDPPFTLWP